MDFDFKERMINAARIMGVPLTETAAGQLLRYKELLLEWNEKMNLTSITDDWEIIQKHFLDSLSVISAAELKNESIKVIDVGAGAGFPGLPLKIILDQIALTSLDSVRKKLGFIEAVIGDLGITGAWTLHSRAEDAGKNQIHRESYDLCLSRAVASLDVLCEFCLPFVKPGGKFIAMKGPKVEEEINAANGALKILGGAVEAAVPVAIPDSDLTHTILIIAKKGHTPPKYPRKAGVVRENPIK